MVKHTQQFVGNLTANCLSVFDHFVGLALKGLSLNELDEMSRTAITLGNFINKPELKSYWLKMFEKCFALVKI